VFGRGGEEEVGWDGDSVEGCGEYSENEGGRAEPDAERGVSLGCGTVLELRTRLYDDIISRLVVAVVFLLHLLLYGSAMRVAAIYVHIFLKGFISTC
jgi:hypothetical protein